MKQKFVCLSLGKSVGQSWLLFGTKRLCTEQVSRRLDVWLQRIGMSGVTLERSAQLFPDRQSALVSDFAPTELQTRVCTLQCIVRFTSYVKSPAPQDQACCLIDSGVPILGRKASGAWNCTYPAPCLCVVLTEIFTLSLAAGSRNAFSLEHSISVFL